MSALLELAARCEAATGADRELDALVAVALGEWPNVLEAEQSATDEDEWSVVEREPDGRKVDRFAPPHFTSSLDAAMTLVPEGMILRRYVATTYVPHGCEVSRGPGFGGWDGNSDHSFALALCAAALRARDTIAEQGASHDL